MIPKLTPELIFSLIFGLGALILVFAIYDDTEKYLITKYQKRLDWMKDKFEKMFLKDKITRNRLLLITFGPAVFLFMLGFFLFLKLLGGILAIMIGSIAFLILGFFLPKFVVGFLYNRRLQKFDNQLIDGLSMISNSLKSGLSLLQGIQVIVKNMPNPISQEFGLVLSENTFGVSLDDTLKNMSERIPSDDLYMTLNSVLILRETGGNLSETFDTLVNTIRERRKVEGKIKSLTAMGMMQGFILSAFPFALGLMFYFSNPQTMKLFVTTTVGWILILLALALVTTGFMIIRKIVSIDV